MEKSVVKSCKFCGKKTEKPKACSRTCAAAIAREASVKAAEARAQDGRSRKSWHPCEVCGSLTRNLKFCGYDCSKVGRTKPKQWNECKVCGVPTLNNGCCSTTCFYLSLRKPLVHSKKLSTKSGVTGVQARAIMPSDEELEEVRRQQNYRCKICKMKVKLVRDHSHTDGHMRGLLCLTCNAGLGMFGDRIDYLKEATKYLETSMY